MFILNFITKKFILIFFSWKSKMYWKVCWVKQASLDCTLQIDKPVHVFMKNSDLWDKMLQVFMGVYL